MPRKKIITEMYSYGIYAPWDRTSATLPKLLEITQKIPVQPEIEFGYVLKIKGAKGEVLHFRIDHPPFNDESGNEMPPFEGTQFIHSNDFDFYLGDTVWPPLANKAGDWLLTTYLNGKTIAQKKLSLFLNKNELVDKNIEEKKREAQ